MGQAAAVDMAAMPMQAARMHTPMMMMQPTRARNFLQPTQAAKSPVAGLIDIEVPLGRKEELDIIVPVTKREEMTMTKRQMVTNALAAAASVLPFAANAKLETDEATKKKICAANPTADACRSKKDPNYVYKPKWRGPSS